jgi:hypothetical protein
MLENTDGDCILLVWFWKIIKDNNSLINHTTGCHQVINMLELKFIQRGAFEVQ